MAKKKPTKKEQLEAFYDEAYNRIPSARSVLCQGCFSRRNTLTVKENLLSLWFRKYISPTFEGTEEKYNAVLILPCYLCHELRQLTLNEWSSQTFRADWENNSEVFMLQKNKDNGFVSMTAISPKIIPEAYPKWCNPK